LQPYNIDLFSFQLDRIYRINRMTVDLLGRGGKLRDDDDPAPVRSGGYPV
jgi:hypothetical protein